MPHEPTDSQGRAPPAPAGPGGTGPTLPTICAWDGGTPEHPLPEPAASPSESGTGRLVGKSLAGRYTVLQLLGRGGMGEVYLARHDLLDKLVAVKLLREGRAGDRDALSRFMREARAAASIGHPNIVEVTDFGFTDEGDAYLVMERLVGRDLRKLIEAEGPLPASRIVGIARQVLKALEAAHQRGIIHRDLKCENIFVVDLGGEDRVKLLDFGISKVLPALRNEAGRGETSLTASGVVIGTPEYISPEQAQAKPDVDHRTDLYSMGVILYKMLTAEVPFSGDSLFQVLYAHVQTPPQPPHLRRPDLAIPMELEQVTLRALRKHPGERYASAAEMMAALEELVTLDNDAEVRAVGPAEAPKTRGPARKRLLLGLLGLTLAAAMAAVTLGPRGDGPAQGPGPEPAPARTAPPPGAGPAPPPSPAPDSRAPDAPRPSRLQLRVQPPEARIYLDGKLAGQGTADLPVRERPARLKVTAPGHHPRTQILEPGAAGVLELSLTPRKPAQDPGLKARDPMTKLPSNPYR